MRKRFNRNAVCSSENYTASKHAHLDMLKEKHDHFCGLLVSGKIELDVPEVKPDGALSSERFKTITIFVPCKQMPPCSAYGLNIYTAMYTNSDRAFTVTSSHKA